MLIAASTTCLWCREEGKRSCGSEGPGECEVSLSLPRSSATGCSERVSYSVERLYKAAVINCLYQPGRAQGRSVAYPYVNQLYRTRLDVVLAGHVTLEVRHPIYGAIGVQRQSKFIAPAYSSHQVDGSNRQALWISIDIYAACQSRHAFGGHCSSIITWYRATRYRTIPIVPDTTEYRPIPDAGIILSHVQGVATSFLYVQGVALPLFTMARGSTTPFFRGLK